MLYTIYKVTHKESGKIYIGKHQTNNLDDGYMGSGKLVRYSINKYGKDAFDKEVLFIFDNEEEMNAKEAELVTEEFCLREDTYNLCPGGHGGWGYVNAFVLTPEDRKLNGSHVYTGPKRKPYTPNGNRRGAPNGIRNGRYNTMWIHNSSGVSRVITKTDKVPDGWFLGRVPVKPKHGRDYSKNIELAKARFKEFKASGLSMRQFAKTVGVSQPALSKLFKKYNLDDLSYISSTSA